jgi:hypothetical protein
MVNPAAINSGIFIITAQKGDLMAGYYDEILEEIRELADAGEHEEALYMIRKELKMPYVPSDFEKAIRSLARDIKAAMNEKKEPKEASLSSLLAGLRGNEASQLASATQLIQRNLRDCLEEIKYFLSHHPCPEAAALIMEAIGEQEIREEFTLVTDTMTAEFYGDSIVPVAESPGFLKALTCLKEWLENDNPSMMEMCRTVLIREVYMFLPLTYDEEEGEDLALRVTQQVSSLLDEGRTYQEILTKLKN